jgi:hypothetical protein
MKKFYIITLLIYYGQHVAAQANQTLSNLAIPTAVNVALLPRNDSSVNLGSTAKSWKNIYLDGSIYMGGLRFLASKAGTGTGNTAVGSAALSSNTSGNYNTATGFDALYSNTTGDQNTADGKAALYSNISGFGNTATGYEALFFNTTGSDNTADGNAALYSNTTGNYNTATGEEALYFNTIGYDNTANGIAALFSNTTGYQNTANGDAALGNNTTGARNTADGQDALFHNITGNANTAVGATALYSNTTGYSNTAIGIVALFYNTNLSNLLAVGDSALYYLNGGSGHCTAVGSEAGWRNTTGGNNTYFGYHAGNTVTTGSSNTIIGYGADDNNAALTNTTALGNLAAATASNQVRIGNTSVTSIGGQVGWSVFSDERVKTNIKENVPGLQFINLLKPITYHYDIDKEQNITGAKTTEKWEGKYDIAQTRFSGFSAQQVEKAAKQIGYDFSGVDAPKNDKDLYALRYSDFVVPLVKAVQELSKKSDDKDSAINDLEARIARVESLINTQQLSLVPSNTEVRGQQLPVSISSVSLEQNTPNPFNHTTTIGYLLPGKFSSAQIIISDKNGNQLKQFDISRGRKGTVTLDASTLTSGTYYYSLYADGKLVASKAMELIK